MTDFDRQLDAALDAYPLVPLPAGFLKRTMERIRPRFRLEFLDLALPGFIVLFLSTLIGLGAWLINSLNPLWLLELRVRIRWYSQNLDLFPVESLTLGGIAILSVCAFVAISVVITLDRPVFVRKA